jgi:hypothetical protein
LLSIPDLFVLLAIHVDRLLLILVIRVISDLLLIHKLFGLVLLLLCNDNLLLLLLGINLTIGHAEKITRIIIGINIYGVIGSLLSVELHATELDHRLGRLLTVIINGD